MTVGNTNFRLTPFNSPVSLVEENNDLCDHGLYFDHQVALSMNKKELEKRFPVLRGKCPKGCGFYGVAYFNNLHYFLVDG